ncbi:MAG: DUF58 domain-containing protein [Rhodospirillaceae bacterium]|jgi:uncharacterized protein (DUF58 family)|nr:DUF58 domain-containing protein [Rhodospirillaceae bacterium]MBT6116249.1 DUF58 domain-containing protein [Rhodospirillaceae bacterium]
MPQASPTERAAKRIAARLPPLLVAAERVADTVSQGLHGRRRVGQGDTFWQFRPYEAGDSAQRIDWRQTAKTAHPHIRETEWTAAQKVWLWRDATASMDYRSDLAAMTKRERAELLLLAIAILLLRGGEHVGLISGGAAPSNDRTTVERLTAGLMGRSPSVVWRDTSGGAPESAETEGDLPPARPLPRHAQLIVASDFLAPLAAVNDALRGFAARGVHGHMIQILDPAEEILPFAGRRRFEGVEDDGAVLIRRAERLRDGYRHRMEAQRAGLAAIARRLGWTFLTHRTDHAPETTLLALHQALSAPPGGRPW